MVKLSITPKVMPSDLLLSPPDDAENTMGKSGHMHGAKIVINPAKNEKPSSVTTCLSLSPHFASNLNSRRGVHASKYAQAIGLTSTSMIKSLRDLIMWALRVDFANWPRR